METRIARICMGGTFFSTNLEQAKEEDKWVNG